MKIHRIRQISVHLLPINESSTPLGQAESPAVGGVGDVRSKITGAWMHLAKREGERWNGTPERIRTSDLVFRKLKYYFEFTRPNNLQISRNQLQTVTIS